MTVTAERVDLDRTRFFIDGAWVEPKGTETHEAFEYQSIHASADRLN